jgi:hypothetical protein
MKTIFVTVSDDRSGRKNGLYGKTQDKVLTFLQNNSFGITDFLFLKYDDILQTEFYNQNKLILDIVEPAFNGRCYKPYAILEGLNKINDNDFLIYNDVSPELWNFIDTNNNINKNIYDINIIKNLCEINNDILTSHCNVTLNDPLINYHTHENYTLDVCMKRMNLEDYKHSLQHASGMICLKKNDKTLNFVKEWLKYNLIDECASVTSFSNINNDNITSSTVYPNFWVNEYVNKLGHRHDQSISGLLINKMNNKLVVSPTNIYPTYNFLSFCIINHTYKFIDSNQSKTKKIIKNILNKETNIHDMVFYDRIE